MSSDRVQVILKWLDAVLREHRSSSLPRVPLLLPSTLAERHRWMPLVEEVFKAADGVVVDALTCRDGVTCGDLQADSPTLVAHVRRFIQDYNELDPTAALSLQVSAGRAEVLGAPFDSVNAAQRAAREFAAAMCDLRLRDSDLAAIVYAEESMDEQTVELVWRAATGMLKVIDGAHAPSTLCIVAGDSQAPPDVNCSGADSLRFRVSDTLSERHAYANSIRPISDLARYSRDDLPLVVLFLGAGASVADGLPTGDRLRDRALEGLTGQRIDATTFERVASEWYAELEARNELHDFEKGEGRQQAFVETLTLERVLEFEQHIDGTPNSSTIRGFASDHLARFEELTAKRQAGELDDDPVVRLTNHRSRLVLVTVNFDRFIEARADVNVRAFTRPEELEAFPDALADYMHNGGQVPLLKLHGSIERPDTLVATIRETTSGLNLGRQTAIQALIDLVKVQAFKSWWYVGYSMRDRDLENVWKGADFPNISEHWVDPFLNPYVKSFIKTYRVPRWMEQGYSSNWTAESRLVSLTASDFTTELANVADHNWT